MMEERGLGTKATRADIIQKLYDRGYVFANPPEPSETGIAMYKAFHEYVPADGDAGDDRRARAGHGPDRGRQDLEGRGPADQPRDAPLDHHRPRGPARGAREADLGGDGRGQVPRPLQGLRGGGPQATRTARRTACGSSSSRAASGCTAARAGTATTPSRPDSCQVSGPLPGRGYELWRLEERCSICGEMPRLTVKGFRGRPWKLCLNDDCPSMVEMRREARGAAAGAGGARRPRENGATAPAPTATAGRLRRRTAGRRSARRRAKPSPGTARTKRARSSTRSQVASSRVRHARGHRPLGEDHPGRAARRGAGARDAPAARARRDRGRRSGSASCSRTRPSSSIRAPSCCCSAPRGRSSARGVVRPALDGGRDVVCDRFIDSTVAYQGAARGLGTDVVEALNEIAVAGCSPDLTVLLRNRPGAGRGPRPAAACGGRGRRRRPLRGRGDRVPAPGRRRLRRARRASRATGSSSIDAEGAVDRGARAGHGGRSRAGRAHDRRDRHPADASRRDRAPARRPRGARRGAGRARPTRTCSPGPPGSGKRAAARAFAAELLAAGGRRIPTTRAGARWPTPRRTRTSSGSPRRAPSISSTRCASG